jgi:hypothetical protein
VPSRINLWVSTNLEDWERALDRYDATIARQKPARLPELEAWYRRELPFAIRARDEPHITHDELVRLTEWKMARGIWRAPNLILVRGNTPGQVVQVTRDAFAQAPHPTQPIATVATLAGVGPATASAAIAAYRSDLYPFFDELVAAQVPSMGKVEWTMGYYARYATALRERATALGGHWTPAMAEQALWSHVGGKVGAH